MVPYFRRLWMGVYVKHLFSHYLVCCVVCIDLIRCGSLMSTSIIAFLLLSKFRTLSVVNCVLHLIVGLLQGVTTGSWEQRKVDIDFNIMKALCTTQWPFLRCFTQCKNTM